MKIQPIVKEPAPILHEKAVPVTEITQEIRELIPVMIDTMHAAEGVGLAANQIGVKWHVLVASPDGDRGKEIALINAEIVERTGRNTSPEGCLSLPGVSSDVTRSAGVTVRGLNPEGKQVTIQATGLLARILQHEVDHLDGHLFVDRLWPLGRRSVLAQYQKLADQLKRVKI